MTVVSGFNPRWITKFRVTAREKASDPHTKTIWFFFVVATETSHKEIT